MSTPRFWPHLLQVEASAEGVASSFVAPLTAAADKLAMRVGWLELGSTADPVLASPGPSQPSLTSLEQAADAGTLRAVAIGGGRTMVLKPMRGEPVLRDVLREHFRGCALVLVAPPTTDAPRWASLADVPRLTQQGDGPFQIATGDREVQLDAIQLVERLRRPRPW